MTMTKTLWNDDPDTQVVDRYTIHDMLPLRPPAPRRMVPGPSVLRFDWETSMHDAISRVLRASAIWADQSRSFVATTACEHTLLQAVEQYRALLRLEP